MVDESFLRSTTMSMDASKRSLAKATSNELEEHKQWLSNETSLEMDPTAAKMEFFSKENSGK